MAILSGLIILFGLLLLVVGGYQSLTGREDAVASALTGLVFAGLGLYLSGRPERASKSPGKIESGPIFDTTTVKAEAEHAEAILSIVQTNDDRIVDAIEGLLADHPRIRTVVSETGRWYATPDRDDLPEWFALRVYVDSELVDEMMAEVVELIREKLGESALDSVSISRFA